MMNYDAIDGCCVVFRCVIDHISHSLTHNSMQKLCYDDVSLFYRMVGWFQRAYFQGFIFTQNTRKHGTSYYLFV